MCNNTRRLFEKRSRFSIRKLTIGTCSVAIGTFLLGANQVQANEVNMETAVSVDNTLPVESEILEPEVALPLAIENANESSVEAMPSASNELQPTATPEMTEQTDHKLHYTRPAATTYEGWEHESLPIGNGEIGSKVYGLIGAEKIQFNEKTLWSGGPLPDSQTYNGGNYTNRHEVLPRIRQALEQGNLALAKRIAQRGLVGPKNHEYGRYLAFGDVSIDFTNQEKTYDSVTDYRRELDLSNAIASTSYTQNGTSYHRESFVSFPDDVSVTHFEKEGDTPLEFTVSMRMTDDLVEAGLAKVRQYATEKSTYKTGTVTYTDEGILLSGHVNDNRLNFASFLGINTDGNVRAEVDRLVVSNATYATLLLNAKTDFAQNPQTNYRQDIDVEAAVKEKVNAAKAKTYRDIKQAHVEDYQSLYNRVRLNLTDAEITTPTDQLLSNYSVENGRHLEELFFQYGRYLMITSSRNKPNALPANLQGVWNAVDNPPWNSDYHLNVNLQMNYWPVYSTNIAETAIPLINYIDDMRYYGRIAAKEYAGIVSQEGEENGWLAHTQATPFGWTTPGWSYYWGWSPASNAWIMQNIYDYYKFTKDEDYLKEKIYPMLKETTKFWNSFLHYDQASDRWVSSPSYSPEHGTITIGNTYDQSLVWQLFHDYIEAAKILGVDQDFVEEVQEKYNKLRPLHINRSGRIKEWFEEDTDRFTGEGVEVGHRHVSELVGLFPGTLFSKDHPEYLEAARNTLNHRGDGGTGWSKANKINLWARLLDGNRAHRLLSEQLKTSTLNNLWDTHSPFQIDGNFGATSGISEMLLQSHTGYIAPLAALPDVWRNGEVTGLVARGNVEVDMTWRDKTLNTMKMTAHKGGAIQIDYPGIEHATVKVNGATVVATNIQADRIEVHTQAGDVITFEDFVGRVLNVVAERTGHNTATVSFDTVAGAHKYTVEREELGLASTGAKAYFDIDTTQFIDRTVQADRQYRYAVRAHLGSTVTAPSDTKTITPVKLMLDDRDSSIQYGALFDNWTDNELFSNTEKYADLTARPTATSEEATATLQFIGTGIEIYGVKAKGLGQMLVTIDNKDMGEIDLYSTTTQKSVLLSRYENLSEGVHTLSIRVKPTHKGRERERAKVSLDYFKVLSNDQTLPEKLDDRDRRIQYGSSFGVWDDATLYGGTETYADIEDNPNVDPANATLSLTFHGTGIRVYGLKTSGLGKGIVTIDGQPVEALDFYTSGTAQKGIVIGEYTGLADGEHTLTIRVDPNTTSRKKISLDAFEILKSPFTPVASPRLHDVFVGASNMRLEMPQGEWTTIRLTLPGVAEPVILARGEAGEYTASTGATVTVDNQNQLVFEVPVTMDQTPNGVIRAVALRGNQESNAVVSLVRANEEVVRYEAGDIEEIAFETTTEQDDVQYEDYAQIRAAGIKGMRTYYNKVYYINGVRDDARTELRSKSEITRPVMHQIQVVGTKPIATYEDIEILSEVPFEEERRDDASLAKGTEIVEVSGKLGITKKVVRKHYRKGELVRQEEVSRREEMPPTKRIVRVGTKVDVSEPIVRVHEATGVTVTFSSLEPVSVAATSVHHTENAMVTPHPSLAGKDYDLYDIEALDAAGQDIDIQYGALVHLPIDSGKTVDQVLYLMDNGEAKSLPFEMKTTGIEFKAQHFSLYAIVYVSPTVPSGGEIIPPTNSEREPLVTQVPSTAPVADPLPTFEGQLLKLDSTATHLLSKDTKDKQLVPQPVLPATGEEAHYAIFGAAAMAILVSVGLAIPTRKYKQTNE